ncbi:MAG: hypothetical protein LBQ92_01725 [Propionibacteriaceae bacterium]|nr:hypothetical protein [Propionibacteriaceae bacterium]
MRVHVVSSPSGVKYVYVQEAYRDAAGIPRHRTVERLGRLDDLLAEDPQALEKLRERYQTVSEALDDRLTIK